MYGCPSTLIEECAESVGSICSVYYLCMQFPSDSISVIGPNKFEAFVSPLHRRHIVVHSIVIILTGMNHKIL